MQVDTLLNCKFLKKLAVTIFFLSPFFLNLHAAPKRYYEDQHTVALREMRDSLDDLRHEVNNHEIEIKTYDEKVKNLEHILDSMTHQSQNNAQAHKEALKDSSNSLEGKIGSLDIQLKSLISDVKQFKNHANETSQSFSQYKQKLIELEKMIEIQNQNMENLQSVLKSMTDILEIKTGTPKSTTISSGNVYKVSPGDSLEKIARKNNTSIQMIKEMNNLENDRIRVGQSLKMP